MENKGQAMLGWLLVVAAGMTVVLAVASRSVSNLKVSERGEESARSFQAAQSALEEAVVNLTETTLTGTVGEGDFSYDYEVSLRSDLLAGGMSFVFPKESVRDDGQVVWLVGHQVDRSGSVPRFVVDRTVRYQGNQLELYWGSPDVGMGVGTGVAASLIYQIQGGSGMEYHMERYIFDTDDTDGCGEGNFTLVGENYAEINDLFTNELVGFRYHQLLTLPVLPDPSADDMYLMLRVRLLCNDDDEPQPLGIRSMSPGLVIPSQAWCYETIAVRSILEEVGQKESTRLQQCLFYPSLPEIFNFSLFSGQEISHD